MSFTRILGLFCFLPVLFPAVSAICWFPDGSPAAQDTPCTSDGLTTCCGQGYACLSNRICKATGEEIRKPGASLFVRGSCTDKSWNNPNCPLFCVTSDVDNVSGGQGIGKCVNTSSDIYYCINSRQNQVNCSSKQNILSFQGCNPRDPTPQICGLPNSRKPDHNHRHRCNITPIYKYHKYHIVSD